MGWKIVIPLDKNVSFVNMNVKKQHVEGKKVIIQKDIPKNISNIFYILNLTQNVIIEKDISKNISNIFYIPDLAQNVVNVG